MVCPCRASPCGVRCLQAAGPQTGYRTFLCCEALPAVVVWELAVFPWEDKTAGPQDGCRELLCWLAPPAVGIWELAVLPWGYRAEGPLTGCRELLCWQAPPAMVVWELAASPRGAPICCLLLYPRDAGLQEGPLVFPGGQASLNAGPGEQVVLSSLPVAMCPVFWGNM